MKLKCKICGKTEESDNWVPSTRKELEDNHICFTCNHWRNLYEHDKTNIHFIVNGEHYIPDNENSKSRFRGFGGALFVIQSLKGTITKSTNLWYQGKISQYWRELMPDNARFLQWNDKGNLVVPCIHCGAEIEIPVSPIKMKAWNPQKDYIQEYFSELTPEQREMFLTSICPNCWNEMFIDEEG